MSSPVDHVVTSGTFSLDGGTWDVDNNVWIVGDEHEVIVIDAAHDLEKIASAVGGRRVVAIVCTHAHDDHVNRRPPSPTASTRRSTCTRPRRRCGRWRTRTASRTTTSATATCSPRAGSSCR